MTTHAQRSHGLPALVGGLLLVLVLTVAWLPRADRIWSISSDEVDELLYRGLDDYQAAIDRSAALQAVLQKALRAPETLSAEESALYVEFERRFFTGWEMVFNYGDGGYLDAERFDVWDRWYRREMARRPDIAWTGNRPFFSTAFTLHVDQATGEQPLQLSDCSVAAPGSALAGTLIERDSTGCAKGVQPGNQ